MDSRLTSCQELKLQKTLFIIIRIILRKKSFASNQLTNIPVLKRMAVYRTRHVLNQELTVVSKPNVINMKKKITAQTLDPFRLDIASGYTMNMRPTSIKIK
jgi:hypothetical protein